MAKEIVFMGGMLILFLSSCQKDQNPTPKLTLDGISYESYPSGSSSLAKGLVAYYPFSGNANDMSGNNLNGTLSGVTPTTDRFGNAGKAYAFSGGSTVIVPHNAKLGFAPTGTFSVSVWVSRTGTQDVMHVIGKRPYHSGIFNWQLAYQNSIRYTTGPVDGFSFGYGGGYYYAVFSQTAVVNPKWTHVAATYNAGKWTMYQDGVARGTYQSLDTDTDVPCDMTIGNSGGYEPFYGAIDDVRIYSRVLSASEVAYLASH